MSSQQLNRGETPPKMCIGQAIRPADLPQQFGCKQHERHAFESAGKVLGKWCLGHYIIDTPRDNHDEQRPCAGHEDRQDGDSQCVADEVGRDPPGPLGRPGDERLHPTACNDQRQHDKHADDRPHRAIPGGSRERRSKASPARAVGEPSNGITQTLDIRCPKRPGALDPQNALVNKLTVLPRNGGNAGLVIKQRDQHRIDIVVIRFDQFREVLIILILQRLPGSVAQLLQVIGIGRNRCISALEPEIDLGVQIDQAKLAVLQTPALELNPVHLRFMLIDLAFDHTEFGNRDFCVRSRMPIASLSPT